MICLPQKYRPMMDDVLRLNELLHKDYSLVNMDLYDEEIMKDEQEVVSRLKAYKSIECTDRKCMVDDLLKLKAESKIRSDLDFLFRKKEKEEKEKLIKEKNLDDFISLDKDILKSIEKTNDSCLIKLGLNYIVDTLILFKDKGIEDTLKISLLRRNTLDTLFSLNLDSLIIIKKSDSLCLANLMLSNYVDQLISYKELVTKKPEIEKQLILNLDSLLNSKVYRSFKLEAEDSIKWQLNKVFKGKIDKIDISLKIMDLDKLLNLKEKLIFKIDSLEQLAEKLKLKDVNLLQLKKDKKIELDATSYNTELKKIIEKELQNLNKTEDSVRNQKILVNDLIKEKKLCQSDVDNLIKWRNDPSINWNVSASTNYSEVRCFLISRLNTNEFKSYNSIIYSICMEISYFLLIWENDYLTKWEENNITRLKQDLSVSSKKALINRLKKELLMETEKYEGIKRVTNITDKGGFTELFTKNADRKVTIVELKEEIRKISHEIVKIELQNIQEGIGSDNDFLGTIISGFVTKYDALYGDNYDELALPNTNASSKKSLLGLGGAINFDVIIGGLVNFIAKRFKEELANQLFDKLKKTLNNDSITEIVVLKTMLPRTHHFLVSIEEYNLPKLFNELKQNVEYDLNHLAEQVYNLKKVPVIRDEIKKDYQAELAFEGFWLYNQMLVMNNPVDLVSKIETMPVCQQWDIPTKTGDTVGKKKYNIANSLKFISLFSNSLTVTNGESRAWMNAEDFKRNIKNENFYYLYFGLLIQQDRNYFNVKFVNKDDKFVVFNDSINKQFATYNDKLKPKFELVLFDFIDAAENVNNQVTLVSKLKKQDIPISSDTIYDLLSASINVIDKAAALGDSLVSFINPDLKVDFKSVQNYIGYARTGAEVYKELGNENYVMALMLVLEKLNSTFTKEDNPIYSERIPSLKDSILSAKMILEEFSNNNYYDKEVFKKNKKAATIYLNEISEIFNKITPGDTSSKNSQALPYLSKSMFIKENLLNIKRTAKLYNTAKLCIIDTTGVVILMGKLEKLDSIFMNRAANKISFVEDTAYINDTALVVLENLSIKNPSFKKSYKRKKNKVIKSLNEIFEILNKIDPKDAAFNDDKASYLSKSILIKVDLTNIKDIAAENIEPKEVLDIETLMAALDNLDAIFLKVNGSGQNDAKSLKSFEEGINAASKSLKIFIINDSYNMKSLNSNKNKAVKSLNVISELLNNLDFKDSAYYSSQISSIQAELVDIKKYVGKLNLDDISKEQLSKYLNEINSLAPVTFISPKTHEILNFVLGLATAKTDEEAAKVIEKAAVPAGSYSIKNKNNCTLSLNSYVGFFAAGEYSVIKPCSWKFNYGFTAPVGFSVNMGFSNGKGNAGWFLSLIDVGALVSFRLSDSTSELPKFDYRNIFAPGVHFVINPINNFPLTLGVGFQKGPNMISYKNTPHRYSGWRIDGFVAVDIPIFYLFKKTRFLNK